MAETTLLTVETCSSGETEELGERIGRALQGGAVLALIGDLGAGKTTLAKGISRGLGVSALVHSPTFTLIHEHAGRVPVYHLDLYRLDSAAELLDLGWEDYLYGEGVCIVEWAEKAPDCLPGDRIEIRITSDGDSRRFEIRGMGPTSSEMIAKIQS